ncbi:DUF7878 domain-containing protein [Hymenobacter rigui]|uniref:DUF7878 domain-containing protein n=1 Tax=Hymenobacter rigui TaxID=334424 RepID=A0A3R9P504_9BACT|nr:hypothetical protein [Hymenobacter rigui]RSK48812.1 hypothetical protein EI291_09605 [Hymenobacter rigui]
MLHYKVAALSVSCPAQYLHEPDLARNKMGCIVVACTEADFEFWQDNVCLLRAPYWNVGQLAAQLIMWLKPGFATDFQFDCMDSESRELFTLRHADLGFQFSSEWGEYEQATYVGREELIQFIQTFSADISTKMKADLGLDASSFLEDS